MATIEITVKSTKHGLVTIDGYYDEIVGNEKEALSEALTWMGEAIVNAHCDYPGEYVIYFPPKTAEGHYCPCKCDY